MVWLPVSSGRSPSASNIEGMSFPRPQRELRIYTTTGNTWRPLDNQGQPALGTVGSIVAGYDDLRALPSSLVKRSRAGSKRPASARPRHSAFHCCCRCSPKDRPPRSANSPALPKDNGRPLELPKRHWREDSLHRCERSGWSVRDRREPIERVGGSPLVSGARSLYLACRGRGGARL